MTLGRLPEGMVELMPGLARLVPPGEVIDKTVYSPWQDGRLEASLQRRGAAAGGSGGGRTRWW